MQSIIARIKAEPVIVTALVAAVLNLAVVFGVPVDDGQKAAILAVVNAVLALFVRSQVSPVSKV